MGGSQSVIVQGEDVKQLYSTKDIDLSNTCLKDAICPPAKFRKDMDNFANKYNDSDIKYILILLILLILLLIYFIKYI